MQATTILNAIKSPILIEALPSRMALAKSQFHIDENMLQHAEESFIIEVINDYLVGLKKSLHSQNPNIEFNPTQVFYVEKRWLYFYKD